jgi:hypothetical protein
VIQNPRRLPLNRPHFIEGSARETYNLGIVTFKLLVEADQTEGVFALGEFAGEEGPWTVLHIQEMRVTASVRKRGYKS